MILLITSFILLATASGLSNYSSSSIRRSSEKMENCKNILTVLEENGLTTLLDLVIKADLATTLVKPESFTIFAPSNEAFENIDPETIQLIAGNPALLTDVLTYHISPLRLSMAILSLVVVEYYVPTVQGQIPIRVNQYQTRRSASTLTINEAQIYESLPTCNGFVYPIGKVLNPRGLSGENTEIQVFKNNGFTTILKILDVVGFTENLNIFFRPETYFAPTDAAFDALPPGILDFLLANPEELIDVLNNHCILGTFYSSGLVTGPIQTVSQAIIEVKVMPGKITYGGANVILTDLTNTQGVIHGIDAVILDQWEPPSNWRQQDY